MSSIGAPLELPFTTIGTMFTSVCDQHAVSGGTAFRYRADDAYQDLSYRDLYQRVASCALGLRSLGISAGDRVGITSENRLEWVIADFACTSIGIVDVPIFPILTDDQLTFIFSNAGVSAVICSNAFQLRKVISDVEEISTLRHIIVMESEAIEKVAPSRRIEPESGEVITIFSLEEVCRRGAEAKRADPEAFQRLVEAVDPDDLLTLIYTSGTTGTPKGVMLTHHNLVSNIKAAGAVIPIKSDDTALSYLPLCHAFERMAGFYTFFALGATIAFAENIDRLVTNLAEVRPTLMTTVPRFLERFRSRVEANIRKGPEKERKAYEWAVEIGRKWFDSMEKKGKVGPILSAKHRMADKLVFSKIRERTGGQLRFFISGGAPLSREVGAYFIAAGMPVLEGYGLTESSPVISANPESRQKLGTVGVPLPGVEVVIAEDGEILARGESIMQGYYNDPVGTGEVIDDENFLHTGDIGEFDEDGYLRITDRKKHLFVSSGGKNIAPGPIEERLLGLPFISQVMLLGDDLPYLAALIVPDFEGVSDGLRLAGHSPIDGTTSEGRRELAESAAVEELILQEIKDLQRDLAAFERVRKIDILPEEFTVENGMMTPTLKVKRKAVHAHFIDEIRALYPGEAIEP